MARSGAVGQQLAELQRARIVAAAFDVVAQRGAGNVTVAHVVARSGVSRRTFYELFTDREDCLQTAFEEALTYASERVLPAYETERGWRERMRAGLIALLRFLDEEPKIGRLLVESPAGGEATIRRRGEAIAVLIGAVEGGRADEKASAAPSSLTAEGVVGGALSVIHARLPKRDREPLLTLTNSLMSMIVLPYLGAAAARRELERPTPEPSGTGRDGALLADPDPFKEAGMRLTYRTVRVLMALAERPGASNRVLAERAEIKDQGQISKLLTRLERAGMIANTYVTPGKGASNSWTLTGKGRQVTQAIRAHTEELE